MPLVHALSHAAGTTWLTSTTLLWNKSSLILKVLMHVCSLLLHRAYCREMCAGHVAPDGTWVAGFFDRNSYQVRWPLLL